MKRTAREFRYPAFFFLLVIMCSVVFSACGRRGDPVPLQPGAQREGGRAEEKTPVKQEGVEGGTAADREKEPETTAQAAPSGLVGVYTRQNVILTWDEAEGMNIRYRIYRSEGAGFVLAGETVTPAFTDSAVQPGITYSYRVTAVGAQEGPPSDVITIRTEMP